MSRAASIRMPLFFYGGELVEAFSMARQTTAARAGSPASRTAVDSTAAAVTPKVRRTESRCRIRPAESIAPTGSFRSAIIVLTNVESLISTKTASLPHAVAINKVPAASDRIRGFNARRVTGDG